MKILTIGFGHTILTLIGFAASGYIVYVLYTIASFLYTIISDIIIYFYWLYKDYEERKKYGMD